VLGVVEPDADDLLRVRHRRQQLNLGQRHRLGRGDSILELTQPLRGEQPAHALAAAAEGDPGIDHLLPAQDPGAGAARGVVGDQAQVGDSTEARGRFLSPIRSFLPFIAGEG